MIEQGTRFIGFSPRVDLSERKTANSNSETEPYTVDDIRGYKVFTALLTQSGTSSWDDQTSGTFTIGVSYNIDTYVAGDDFSNIGGPPASVNGAWDGYWFIATGTTPLNYSNGSYVQWNTGAPVATVLDNTIGNVWFTYEDVGVYVGNIIGGFVAGKTSVSNSLASYMAPLIINSISTVDGSVVAINSLDLTYNSVELEGTVLIEIRVYN